MKAKITLEPPGTVTYTTVANHISTAVSELPDYVAKNRTISGLQQSGASNGVFNDDGTINTGHHINWLNYSPGDRKKVNDERARLGLGKNKRRQDKPKGRTPSSNQIEALKKANAQHKRTIASLKKDPPKETSQAEVNDIETDAGDSFGGKAKKVKINN